MKTIKTFTFAFLTLTIISCGKKVENHPSNANGFWKQIGYGKFIQIQDSLIKVYDSSKVDCHLSFEEDILDFGKIKRVTMDTLTIQHGIDNWLFTRISELPKVCLPTSKNSNIDPLYNFETFWHTFNENYFAFTLKGINWNEYYSRYAPKISTQTTDLELYQIMDEIISTLNDGHTNIELPDAIAEEYMKKQKPQKPKYSKLDEFEIMENLAKPYVDSLRSYNSGMVRWGMIENEIGYLQFNSMLMVANYDLDPDYGLAEFYGKFWARAEQSKDEIQRLEEVDGSTYILNKVLTDLNEAKAFILDLRFNGGGKDGVALNLLNHFVDQPLTIGTKRAWHLDEPTFIEDLSLHPSSTTFKGPVYLLQSHRTSSAAELAALGSLAIPDFIRIGSRTEGIFSSTLDKTLPNGWEYELSNEIYLDQEGNNYEHVGIPADYPLNYSKNKDDFFSNLEKQATENRDEAIEKALSLWLKNE